MKPSLTSSATAATGRLRGLPQAANCARRLIELAPFRESGYRILMEAFERSGNVAEALRVYDGLRVMLRDELGIPPSSAVQDIYRRLLGDIPANA